MAEGEGDRNTHLGRVLVVDDDPAILKVCARVLGAEGWVITLAANGRAAIEALDVPNTLFDCVLSDVNMPELDGFELVSAIRKRDDELPVLLMTGAAPEPYAPNVMPLFEIELVTLAVNVSPRRKRMRLLLPLLPEIAESKLLLVTCLAPFGQPVKFAVVETQVVAVLA